MRSITSPYPRAALAAALLLATTAPAFANATKTFHQSTAKDFEEGEATGTMILPTGEVVPGMKTSPVAAEASFVWCSALSRDGSVAYFGSGDEGQIFAVEARGGGSSEKAKRVAKLDVPWVTALAVRKDG